VLTLDLEDALGSESALAGQRSQRAFWAELCGNAWQASPIIVAVPCRAVGKDAATTSRCA